MLVPTEPRVGEALGRSPAIRWQVQRFEHAPDFVAPTELGGKGLEAGVDMRESVGQECRCCACSTVGAHAVPVKRPVDRAVAAASSRHYGATRDIRATIRDMAANAPGLLRGTFQRAPGRPRAEHPTSFRSSSTTDRQKSP
jgi:hypothetical protein